MRKSVYFNEIDYIFAIFWSKGHSSYSIMHFILIRWILLKSLVHFSVIRMGFLEVGVNKKALTLIWEMIDDVVLIYGNHMFCCYYSF